MIEAKGISLTVKGKQILKSHDFVTDREEFIIILGPNGAGKSTLVKLLSGGLQPSSGIVSYYGKELKGWTVDALSKYRAYMHQESLIASSFTVREVLEMARYRYLENKLFNQQVIDNMVEELNLHSLLHVEFNLLSGGEKQRVQFGRVLLQLENDTQTQTSQFKRKEKFEIQPIKYLFLDEPLNNLDVRYQIELLQRARKFVDKKFGTVVLVMHDVNLCHAFADRVLLMQHGSVILDGSVKEVLQPDILSEIYQIKLNQIHSQHGEVFYQHCNHSEKSFEFQKLGV